MRVHLLLVTATAAAAVAATTATAADRVLVEAIVVRVNERVLTVADMRKRVAERTAETGAAIPPEAYPDLVTEAADDLCLLERAVELKIEINDEEVTQAIKGLREQNKIENDEQFDKTLRGLGLSLDQLRARMRDQMMMNRVLSREVGNLPVTDEELRQRFAREQDNYRVPEQVHLEHLVLAIGPEAGAATLALADARKLVAAARSGTDFAALIKQEVDGGRASGGDLGVVALPDLRPEVRDAIAALKPGELSDPFTSAAGIHVVRLVERFAPSVKPFEQVADELRQREMADRYRGKLSSVVADLKKRYIVEVHPELFTPPA